MESEGDNRVTHPMERVAVLASIGLAAILIRTWVIVENVDHHVHRSEHAHHSSDTIVYRAEWNDSKGILRSVETRGDSTEPLADLLARHRLMIENLASLYPPR